MVAWASPDALQVLWLVAELATSSSAAAANSMIVITVPRMRISFLPSQHVYVQLNGTLPNRAANVVDRRRFPVSDTRNTL